MFFVLFGFRFIISDVRDPRRVEFFFFFGILFYNLKKISFSKGDFESGFQSALNLLGLFSSGVTGFSSENLFAV